MALLFSDRVDITNEREVHRDASGRCLVIACTLYARHKCLFVVSHAPCPEAASRTYFERLETALLDKAKIPDLHERTVVWMGDFNALTRTALMSYSSQVGSPKSDGSGVTPFCRTVTAQRAVARAAGVGQRTRVELTAVSGASTGLRVLVLEGCVSGVVWAL